MAFIITAVPVYAGAQQVREGQVLILNSYHQGFTWTDQEVAGILEVLHQTFPRMDPLVEYMDWKRFPSRENLEKLRTLYRSKYAGVKIAVIITTDNVALEFAMQHRAELFPGAAIVFCGLNGYDDTMLAGHRGITGVTEDVDPAGTIELALRLHRQTQEIVVISDDTESAREIRKQIDAITPRFIHQASITHLENLKVDELVYIIERLPHDSIILMSAFNRDRAGRIMSHEESVSLVSGRARVPVYGLWSLMLGKGIVGGNLLSGQVQGREAAQYAVQILKGADPSTLPVITRSTSPPMFDHAQMIRFKIARSTLPEGSIVINEPLQIDKLTAALIVGVMLLLSGVIVSLLINIGQRRAVEQRLSDSEAKFSKAFHSSPDGVTISEIENGRILEANEAFLRMLGYTRNEVIGRTMDELGIFAEPGAQEQLVASLIEKGSLRNREGVFLARTGSPVSVLISAEQVTLVGKPCILSISRDITDYKRMESQLLKAQKLESLGTLTGGIAHDFNNMLTAIMGYSDLLSLRLGEGSPLRRHVDSIIATAKRAGNLTQSLLSFGKRQMVRRENENLNTIVDTLRPMLRRIMREDIDIIINLSSDPLVVNANSGQIEQLLINLATNAADAMPRGGSFTITTGAYPIDRVFIDRFGYGKEGLYALLSVSDTGVGMDDKTRDRIFEPFFTTKGVEKGTGLGLAMVYGIVKQHEGFISVDSELGKGACFAIYLPLQTGRAAAVMAAEEEAPVGGFETILVAEDEEHVRLLIRTLLTEFGYAVIEARDGGEAIELARSSTGPLHLLLADIIMPAKNGKETYDAVRLIKPGIRCLFMSGYTHDIIDETLLESGVEFISKPVRPKELLRKIREVLDKKRDKEK